MESDNNKYGCGCLIVVALIAICVNIFDKDEKEKEKDNRIETSTTQVVEIPKVDPIIEQYGENRLSTGGQPYDNEVTIKGSESRIIVKTSGTDRTDVVVILKRNDKIVRNQYIQAGGKAMFNIPDGTYQIFFYYGMGWYPDKEMPNGMKGGFVQYESFSKDDPQFLSNNILTYELILQTDGNFSARPSNAEEAF